MSGALAGRVACVLVGRVACVLRVARAMCVVLASRVGEAWARRAPHALASRVGGAVASRGAHALVNACWLVAWAAGAD